MNSFTRNCTKHLVSCLIMSCILLVGTTGCENPEKLQKTQDTINQTEFQVPSVQPTSVIREDEIGFKNFKPIQQSCIKYDFNVKLNGAKEDPISFLVEGEYDLDQNGSPDKINILLQGHLGGDQDIQTYIKINEVKQDFYMDYTYDGEVRVIDLDKNDNFTEIAIFDEGPSGDPHYIFYRYDGEKLYKIGETDSAALIDGEGKLISSFCISRFTPRFYSAWCEINNNEFILKTNDIEGYLDKSYEFEGGEAYFIPTKEMPKEFMPVWGETKRFKATDLKLIDVYFSSPQDKILNYYFVEFPNGEKGMLYFWIGD